MEDARRIVELYTPQAYAIAYRLTGNQAEAWDLVQNAMLRVLKSYATYDPTYKVEQWLHRIIRNLWIDRLRLETRRREQSMDAPLDERGRTFGETLVDPAPAPDAVLDREGARDAVRRALGELPEELRMALILVDIEGCSYEEAAKSLGMPVSTLGVHVFRGRKALKRRLAGFMEGKA